MFTVEIRINGTLIGHIYGRNMGRNPGGKTRYDYEYYEPELPNVRKGSVMHERDGGIRPLIAAILADVPAEKP